MPLHPSSFGFAAGPLIWGPMSEMLGRRLVYIITGIFYTAFSFGAAWSPNAGGLLVFRFLIGFFGSASINNVPAS
jgi:MFS transporter, DHA1 family, multidrug resistance protein